ncbi:MAG TPA: HD domain-containing phosphohydrolase [Actinomycetota bacterium]|nr:HD domain-containing phosphohydrolase [Actinomycetota bacterium]
MVPNEPAVAAAAPSARVTGTRLAELICVLSLSSDLALGQPMEHVLRSCLIAQRLAERMGLDEAERCETYWVTLLATVCTGESFELMQLFGDDIAFRAGVFHVGPSQLAQMFFLLGRAGSGRPAPERMQAAAGMMLTRARAVEASLLSHTALTADVAHRVGLDAGVSPALRQTFARWDGKGVPRGVAGEAIARSVRLMVLAEFTEVHHRLQGVDGAVAMVRRNAGKQLAPETAAAFCAAPQEILAGLEEATWEQALAAEPLARPPLGDDELETVLGVLADIADLKSPWFAGHSRGVAALAGTAVQAAGLPARDVTTVRRAGLVHELGRTGVPNSIWDKPGPFTEGERERARLASYYTERMLRRPAALAGVAAIASSVHERLDGSGYHRGIRGPEIPLLGRYLAAADVYHALLEERPHRPGTTPGRAADQLRHQAREGRLDAAAVDAVLGVTGQRSVHEPAAPAGLTPREVEVLLLVARGATTRQVARALDITPKTAGNHIERIYAKIGASSRAMATLFAMQHGMLATLEPLEPLHP